LHFKITGPPLIRPKAASFRSCPDKASVRTSAPQTAGNTSVSHLEKIRHIDGHRLFFFPSPRSQSSRRLASVVRGQADSASACCLLSAQACRLHRHRNLFRTQGEREHKPWCIPLRSPFWMNHCTASTVKPGRLLILNRPACHPREAYHGSKNHVDDHRPPGSAGLYDPCSVQQVLKSDRTFGRTQKLVKHAALGKVTSDRCSNFLHLHRAIARGPIAVCSSQPSPARSTDLRHPDKPRAVHPAHRSH